MPTHRSLLDVWRDDLTPYAIRLPFTPPRTPPISRICLALPVGSARCVKALAFAT